MSPKKNDLRSVRFTCSRSAALARHKAKVLTALRFPQGSSGPESFTVYHYNGLKQSNHSEKVSCPLTAGRPHPAQGIAENTMPSGSHSTAAWGDYYSGSPFTMTVYFRTGCILIFPLHDTHWDLCRIVSLWRNKYTCRRVVTFGYVDITEWT